jgi:hypothetical protein
MTDTMRGDAPAKERCVKKRRPPSQRLDRDTADEMLASQFGSPLHVDQLLPRSLDPQDRASVTIPPDASAALSQGVIFDRQRGVSFHPAPTPVRRQLLRERAIRGARPPLAAETRRPAADARSRY